MKSPYELKVQTSKNQSKMHQICIQNPWKKNKRLLIEIWSILPPKMEAKSIRNHSKIDSGGVLEPRWCQPPPRPHLESIWDQFWSIWDGFCMDFEGFRWISGFKTHSFATFPWEGVLPLSYFKKWLSFFDLWLSFFDTWPAFKLTHLHFSCRRRFFCFQHFVFFSLGG